MRHLSESSKTAISWSVTMTLESSPLSSPVGPGAEAVRKRMQRCYQGSKSFAAPTIVLPGMRRILPCQGPAAPVIAPVWGRTGFGHLLGGKTNLWDDVEMDFSHLLREWSTSNARVKKQFFPWADLHSSLGVFHLPLWYQTWPLVRLLQSLLGRLLPAAWAPWRQPVVPHFHSSFVFFLCVIVTENNY